MNDSVFPATFDPLFVNAPDACSLCIAQPPVFQYEYCVEQGGGERPLHQGLLLRRGRAAGLLKKLEGEEAQEWAEEEEELQADDMDVSDLQKRRLATFGNIRR